MHLRTTLMWLNLFLFSLPSAAIDEIDDEDTISAAFSRPLFDCERELIKLIAGSNHELIRAERVTSDKLSIMIEKHHIDELAIQLFDKSQTPSPDSPGAGQLGWMTYNIKDNRLQATGPDEDHPLTLTFNPVQGKRLQSCLRKEQECHQMLNRLPLEAFIAQSPQWRVTGKGRAYFHAAPTEQCRNDNWFVVPGDILQVNGLRATKSIDGNSNDWLLVAYGDAHGWINMNRLAPIGEATY